MTPTNDKDFAQFEGAFDFLQAPDPTFAEILRRRMADERVSAPVQRTTILASPPSNAPQVQKPAVVPPPSRRPIWAAVAALLVVAIIGASVWQISDLVNEGQYAGAPEVVLPADASVTPGPDVELKSTRLMTDPNAGYRGIYGIYDNVLIYNSDVEIEGVYQNVTTIAVDLTTGDQLWSKEGWDYYAESYYDGVFYGYVVDENESRVATNADSTEFVVSQSLAAVDVRNGVELWRTPLPRLESSNYAMYWSNPVVSPKAVYTTSFDTVIALSPSDGRELWSVDSGLESLDDMSTAALALSPYALAVVSSGGQVLMLNPDNGQLVSEHIVDLDLGDSGFWTRSISAGSTTHGVIAIWTTYQAGEPVSHTMLLDPKTGSAMTSVITDGSSGGESIAADGSVAFVPNRWHQGNLLMRILGRGGYTSFSLVWVDAVAGKTRLSTDYVRVSDYSTMVVVNNGDYVCYAMNSFDCYDRSGTRYPVTDRSVYWTQIVDSRLYYSTDGGIFIVDLP